MTAKWSYWNGPDEEDRREKYAKAFREEFQANGDDLQRRITAVETAFRSETGAELPEGYASGWRSPSINEATSHAGKKSTHLTANGGDKRDTADGEFAWWCLRNKHILERHGLYQEHPVATVVRAWKVAKEQGRAPTPWCHLQSVPPTSNSRVYFPDTASVTEWQAFRDFGGVEGMSYAAWFTLQEKRARRKGVSTEEEEA